MERILELDPQMKVIFMSGYSDVQLEMEARERFPFIQSRSASGNSLLSCRYLSVQIVGAHFLELDRSQIGWTAGCLACLAPRGFRDCPSPVPTVKRTR